MEIINWKKANELGLPRYFTGKPCKNGHIAERNTKSSHCVECEPRKLRLYYEANREKLIAYAKNYEEKNKEIVKQKKKERYERNKQEIIAKERKKYEQNPAWRMWNSAKSRAKKDNIKFDITVEDVEVLIPSNKLCPILGIEMKINYEKSFPNSMSLDKIKPEFGYVKNNIAVISYLANTLKRDQTDPEIFRKIANWLEMQKYA